jgi:hypothetical protein
MQSSHYINELEKSTVNMPAKNPSREAWKPGVPKSALVLIAGIMWIAVAIMLNWLSYSWLKTESRGSALCALLIGFVGALVIHHFGFLRLVDKNLARIIPMEGKQCVFSFMPWKSYILIMIMILMGFLLRHSPIPKLYLAGLYTAIGTALILSSVRYVRYYFLVMTGISPINRDIID